MMRAPSDSTTIEETAFETVTVSGSQSVTLAFAEVKITNDSKEKNRNRNITISRNIHEYFIGRISTCARRSPSPIINSNSSHSMPHFIWRSSLPPKELRPAAEP
jgi:hypothetical protein